VTDTSLQTGTLGAFRSRDFRLLWFGQTVSFTGDAAFIVAVGWRVTELGGSLAFVLAAESVALLTTLLWGGVLADRYPRRLLMIGSDLARAGCAAVFLALDASGNLTTQSVVVLVVFFGLADGFFQPAFGGIVPLVVEQPLLASASSWISIARQGSLVVGPAVAAALYGTVGPNTVWAIDGASFVVSATALWLARPRVVAPEPREGMFRELAAGFRYVAHVPWIWTGIGIATFILMVAFAPYTALLPKIVQSHYGGDVGAYGLLFSLMAAGMVAGSLLYARWNPRRHRVLICFGAFGINDLGIIVVALSPWYWLATIAVVWRGFFIGIGIAAWLTMLTELVPEGLLSRVLSLDHFGSFALTPVGFVVAGAAASVLPATTVVAVGGAIGLVLWFVPLAWREVRVAA
jgi:MFS family permease